MLTRWLNYWQLQKVSFLNQVISTASCWQLGFMTLAGCCKFKSFLRREIYLPHVKIHNLWASANCERDSQRRVWGKAVGGKERSVWTWRTDGKEFRKKISICSQFPQMKKKTFVFDSNFNCNRIVFVQLTVAKDFDFVPCRWISVEVMQRCVFVNKLRKPRSALACVREFNGWPNFLSTGIIVEKIVHNSMLNMKKITLNMLSVDVSVVGSWDLFSLRLFFHENFVSCLTFVFLCFFLWALETECSRWSCMSQHRSADDRVGSHVFLSSAVGQGKFQSFSLFRLTSPRCLLQKCVRHNVRAEI